MRHADPCKSGQVRRLPDVVTTIRDDVMGRSREGRVFAIARHADAAVRMFGEWDLPFLKPADGWYLREGKWQVMIHGESYESIAAEAEEMAIGNENVYQRVFVSHLLKDKRDTNHIAGATEFRWHCAVGEGGVFSGQPCHRSLRLIITG